MSRASGKVWRQWVSCFRLGATDVAVMSATRAEERSLQFARDPRSAGAFGGGVLLYYFMATINVANRIVSEERNLLFFLRALPGTLAVDAATRNHN